MQHSEKLQPGLTELQLRIDWSELDLFGHVNNVMFMKYIQASRVHYWEQIGLYQHFLRTKQGPMLAAVNCDFKKPLFYPGNIHIEARMVYIRNSSFSLRHRILNEQREIAAEAEDVMVMFDFNENRKLTFPQEFRDAVERVEGRKF